MDTDPGIGVATDVPVTAAPSLTNLTFDRSLAALPDGLHKLYFRVKDANGMWSTTESTPFYRWTVTPTPPPAAVNITHAEYFIDTDLGAGNATAITITPGLSLTNLPLNFSVASLTDGFHKLFVRVKDANNNWSTTEQTFFYKMTFSTTPPPPAVNLTNAEYFIDTDPGLGNATAIAITPSVSVTDLLLQIDVSSLPDGNHKLYVRFKDANNLWSVPQPSSFAVCNQAIPPVAAAANAVTTSGFTANWAAAADATSYSLDVSADNFATFVSGYNAKSVTGISQVVAGLSPGVAYGYRVRTVNATCTSVSSNVINATTLFTTPTANSAINITSSGFTARWSTVTGATSYLLDISTDNFATFIAGYNAKSTTALSEVVTGLVAGTAYQYRVRATNGVGTSANSSTITATTTASTKQNQTITFGALAAKAFGDAAFTLSATSSSLLAVSYASSNTAVATISGNTATIVGVGTTTITASQAGNDGFNAAPNVTQTLTVNKANQTIVFAALPAKSVTDAPFTLTATGGASGLPVTFTSSNTAVATVSGNTVTLVGAGSTNITASQAGNANYNAAANVQQTLTVNAKQDQTISFNALADVTVGASFSLTATASSGLMVSYTTNPTKATINGTLVTTLKAGRDTITAMQPGNSSFNAAAAVLRSFCIKPSKPTLTLSNTNTATITLTSSATSGNQWYLAGSVITGATNQTLAVTTPGAYKVQVKVDDCISDFSDDQAVVITGDIAAGASLISISPNPVEGMLQLNGIEGGIKSNVLFDLTGRPVSPLVLEKKNDVYQADVEHLSQGLYVLRILQEDKVIQLKFVKK